METLPCQGCKGLCCGPVPITGQELKTIKKKLKSMPSKLRSNLEHQERYYGTCIFYDLDNNQCGIYSARPEVCRAFGHYKNLVCGFKPEVAIKGMWSAEDKHIGYLSVDITWKDF